MVRQRSVVHQTGIGAGRKRVRAFGRHGTFGRHPRMRHRMGTRPARQMQPFGHRVRISDPLEQLHRRTDAQHADIGCIGNQPVARRLPIRRLEDRMIRQRAHRNRANGFGQSRLIGRPIRLSSPRQHGYTVMRRLPAVHREACRVRSARRHLAQHQRRQATKIALQGGRLQVEANNPTHRQLPPFGPPDTGLKISLSRNFSSLE